MRFHETTVLLDPAAPPVTAGAGHCSRDLESTSLAWLVDHAVARIPSPTDPLEALQYRMMLDDLAHGDGNAAATRLEPHGDGFGGAYALLPFYCAIIQVVSAFDTARFALSGRDHLLRCIRHQTRNEFARLPAHRTVEWVVPAAPGDRTAAHVAALILARLGTVSRPWLWTMFPVHGPFTILGATARVHPAAGHHRCQECLTFTEAADRLAHLC